MKTAKFDYTDYSLLDSIYSETGRKPKYREVLEKLRQSVSSDYSPSHKTVYAYIDAWRLERFGDSQLKKQNIISDSHTLTEKLSQIVSQVSEFESTVSKIDNPDSDEFEFLKLQVSSLEEQNRQLLVENEKLCGKIEGFEQAIESVKFLISQRDIDIISQIHLLPREKEKAPEFEVEPDYFLEFKAQCLSILQKSGRSELENYLNTFMVAKLHDFCALMSPTDKPAKRSTKLKFINFLISQFEST